MKVNSVRRLIFRKRLMTPNKEFIASAYRVEDEFGVRFDVSFTQIAVNEVRDRDTAILEVTKLITAASNAYLASPGDE